jgi:vancomycin resistance protein VanW
MKKLKRLVPPKLRLFLRVILLRTKDKFSGTQNKFPNLTQGRIETGRAFPEQITIVQPINKSKWAENKKRNLRLAVSTFQDMAIDPDEIFSFWRQVGNPTKKAGYKVGINIIQSKLGFDYGGGLCQLSGLLYHLALSAGLGIVERHPHSLDLYTDETRYTPLGADATTVYGYKDLRIKNTMDFSFCFRIHVDNDNLTGSICSAEKIKPYELEFKKEVFDGKEKVMTIRLSSTGEKELICTQVYLISDHDVIL